MRNSSLPPSFSGYFLPAALTGSQSHTPLCTHRAQQWSKRLRAGSQGPISLASLRPLCFLAPFTKPDLAKGGPWPGYYFCLVSLECLRGGISSYNREDAECLKKPKSRELKDTGDTRILYTPNYWPNLSYELPHSIACFQRLSSQAKEAPLSSNSLFQVC